MKKIITAVIISCSSAAYAGGVGLSGVYDVKAERSGVRLSAQAYGVNVSATHLDKLYDRYSVGKDIDLFKIAGIRVQASPGVVHQNSFKGHDGYGISGGLKSSFNLSKNISLVGGVEHFIGQSRIKSNNGTAATVGINFTF